MNVFTDIMKFKICIGICVCRYAHKNTYTYFADMHTWFLLSYVWKVSLAKRWMRSIALHQERYKIRSLKKSLKACSSCWTHRWGGSSMDLVWCALDVIICQLYPEDICALCVDVVSDTVILEAWAGLARICWLRKMEAETHLILYKFCCLHM